MARLAISETGESPAPTADANEDDSLRGRGRQKFSIVVGEITVLPRHWD